MTCSSISRKFDRHPVSALARAPYLEFFDSPYSLCVHTTNPVDCRPGSALKIFVYMSGINKETPLTIVNKTRYRFFVYT